MSNARKIFGLCTTGVVCLITGGVPELSISLANTITTSLAPGFATNFLFGIDYKKVLRFKDSTDSLNYYLDKLIVPVTLRAVRLIKNLYVDQLKDEHQLTWIEQRFSTNPVREAKRIFDEIISDWKNWKNDELIERDKLLDPNKIFDELYEYIFTVSSGSQGDVEEWKKLTSFIREKLPYCFELAFKEAIVENANEPAFKSYQIELLRTIYHGNEGVQEDLSFIKKEIERLQGGGTTNETLVDAIQEQIKDHTIEPKLHFDEGFAGIRNILQDLRRVSEESHRKTQEMVSNLTTIVKNRRQNTQTLPRELNNIPHQFDRIIGRQVELHSLKESLDNADKIVQVQGMGGIGKTTLANFFVKTYYPDYDHLVWVDVKTKDGDSELEMTTAEAFAYDVTLTANLGLHWESSVAPEEKFALICNRLQNLPASNNLLVIDNIKADFNKIMHILPGAPGWKVLITGREVIPNTHLYKIGELPAGKAKELFKVHYTREADESDIDALLEEISYHMMTIELIAKTLAFEGQRLTLPDALTRFKEKKIDSPALRRTIATTHSKEETDMFMHLIRTFNLSCLDAHEQWVLKQFYFLLPRQFEVQELEDFLELESEEQQAQFQQTLHCLGKRGWLIVGSYGIHRTIQQMVYYQLNPRLNDCKQLVLKFSKLLSHSASIDSPKLFQYIPYGEFLLSQLNIEDRRHPEIGVLQNNLGNILSESGAYQKACSFLILALDNGLENFDKHHSEIAIRRSNLASVYRTLGQYKEAEALFQKSLESNILNFGENAPSVADIRSNLALVYYNLGRYKEAMKLLKKVVKSNIKSFGENHHSVAQGRSNLSEMYRKLGQYDEAIRLLKKALSSDIANLGEDHSSVAIRYSNLAIIYIEIGKYDEAEKLLQNALTSDLKNFGEDHSYVAIRRSNLATVYKNTGRYEEAVELQQKALVSDMNTFGEDHPTVALRRSNLADIYGRLGRYEEAAGMFQKALSAYLRIFGETHSDVATIRSNLAMIYRDLGRFRDAAELLQKALESDLKKFGVNHLSVARCRFNLGIVYTDLGKILEAKVLLEPAYQSYLTILGPNHRHTQASKSWLDEVNKRIASRF